MNVDYLKPKENLNRKIWKSEDKIYANIKDALLKIAEKFIDETELNISYSDIVFTGSLANYNYNVTSDIDLHIIIKDVYSGNAEKFLEKFLSAKKSYWNENHDIKILGYDVEIYPEFDEAGHSSGGVYSLMKDKWIVKPEKFKSEPDFNAVIKKYNDLKSQIDDALKNAKSEKEVERLLEKIRKKRKAGLNRSGELSVENLAYKVLRRKGLIQKLFDLSNRLYDKKYSLEK